MVTIFLTMLDFSYWIMDFSNEFVSNTINFNFNFDRKREKEEYNFWKNKKILHSQTTTTYLNVLIKCWTFGNNVIFKKYLFIY